jgi:hypothetical protein
MKEEEHVRRSGSGSGIHLPPAPPLARHQPERKGTLKPAPADELLHSVTGPAVTDDDFEGNTALLLQMRKQSRQFSTIVQHRDDE